jgi:drug/metabolite transporter (DMT)-like permease
MDWLGLSLLYASVAGVINVIDKILVGKHVKVPFILTILVGLYSAAPAAIVLCIGIEKISWKLILLCIIPGAAIILYTLLYFKALKLADAPVVASSFQMVSIFSVLWGYLFFNELFKIQTYAGILLLISGVALISLEKKKAESGRSTTGIGASLFLILPATILMSSGYALQKYALKFTNTLTVFFWGRIGSLLAALLILLLFSKLRHTFISEFPRSKTINLVIMLNELVFFAIVFVQVTAFSRGPLSLVATAISAQPLFVFFYILFIKIIKPRYVIDSSMSKPLILFRFLLILMIIFGIYLLKS